MRSLLRSKICLFLCSFSILVFSASIMVANCEQQHRRTARTPRAEVGGAFNFFDDLVPQHWHGLQPQPQVPSASSASVETDEEHRLGGQMPWHLAHHGTALGWAQWSDWSACTRKCGSEGVQFQLRRCLDMYCSGPSARHRICGKKPCSPNDSIVSSSIAIECALRSSAHDELLPVTSIQNCSSLQCVSRRNGTLHNFGMSLRDGTNCHLGNDNVNPTSSAAVCFDGKCRAVGCDGIIGSLAREDQCGVCAGDGSTCAGQLFRWRDTGHYSPCDKSCGPNSIRVSVSVCVNIHTDRVVPERMCADRARPRPTIRRCAHIVCPSKWLAGEWSDCSATCGTSAGGGGGEQRREVFCVERVVNVNNMTTTEEEEENTMVMVDHRRVDDQHCWQQSQKPADVRKCSTDACPEWLAGEWGPCSATCGRGMRRRSVKCVRANVEQQQQQQQQQLFHELYCAAQMKPAQEQHCWSGISCPGMEGPKQLMSYAEGNADDGGMRPTFIASAWGECSASCGPSIRSRLVECMAASAGGAQRRLPDYECQDQPKPAQFRPCHLAPCPLRGTPAQSAIRSLSNPFGDGGGDPTSSNEQQRQRTKIKNGTGGGTFRWEHSNDWTKCSAPCSGGKQKAPVVCMDTVRRVTVASAICERDSAGAGQRPPELTRACNRQPCTPDWEIGPWSACSHTCGGGLRTRRVRCVRTAHGASATPTSPATDAGGTLLLVMPDAQCPGLRPGDEEPCGVVDCAPEWLAGHWGQCSASCGMDGEQRRVLRCVRRDSLGDMLTLDDAKCPQAQKPATVRQCSLGPCPDTSMEQTFTYGDNGGTFFPSPPASLSLSKDEPLMEADNDEDGTSSPPPTERMHRKLTLKVGGFANLYEGTSVKIKCPLKAGGGDRRRIVWSKDDRRVENSLRLKVSANGALRIFRATLSDAGVYACRTADGRAQGNVTLRFKPANQHQTEKTSSTGDNRTRQQQRKDIELLQRVRDSIRRQDGTAGRASQLQRLASAANDPTSQIRLDYAASSWAECHQAQCGRGEGVQVRLLKCQVHVGSGLPDDAIVVETNICEAFDVPRPAATRPCADERCPRWTSGAWSDCVTSRCVRHGTAMMKRDVRCAFSNGTLAPAALCDRRTRPKLKRECENANCFAEWRPSVWGRCSKSCGDGGVQMRLLRCVWRGTRKPAGRNCEQSQQRPATIRACEQPQRRTTLLPPCDDLSPEGDVDRFGTTNIGGGRDGEKSETVHGSKHAGVKAVQSGTAEMPQAFVPNNYPATTKDGTSTSNVYDLGSIDDEEKPIPDAIGEEEKPASDDLAEEEKPMPPDALGEEKLFANTVRKEKPPNLNTLWEQNPIPYAIREEEEEKPISPDALRDGKASENAHGTVLSRPENAAILHDDGGRWLRDVGGGNGTGSMVKPFSGWHRWCGWRFYGRRPPAHFGGADDNAQMRRRF